MVDRLIGCSISASTRYNYEGRFRKWELRRSLNELNPYLSTESADKELEEDSLLNYLSLSVGPLNKDMSTMITRIHGIGRVQKLKRGTNPIGGMPRVQLTIRGCDVKKDPHLGLGNAQDLTGSGYRGSSNCSVRCTTGLVLYAQDE